MGASTLDRLMNLQQKRKGQAPVALTEAPSLEAGAQAPVPNTPSAPAASTATPTSIGTDHTLHQSLMQEQLESIYADFSYLTKAFPGHNLRSLVDYAKELHAKYGQQLAAAAQESGRTLQNHGIIPAQIYAKLDRLDEEAANNAQVAVIELDDTGNVLWMSPVARSIVHPTTTDHANFFTEVCPGANNSLFFGRFREGVFRKAMDLPFRYLFAYKTSPTAVNVHMIRETRTGRNFIFFAPIEE